MAESTLVTLSIDYGYDLHSIEIERSLLGRARSGERLTAEGQGFHIEGEETQDWWAFNEGEPGSLRVSCDDGFEVFVGSIADASIS